MWLPSSPSPSIYICTPTAPRNCPFCFLLQPPLFFILKRVFCPRRVFVCFHHGRYALVVLTSPCHLGASYRVPPFLLACSPFPLAVPHFRHQYSLFAERCGQLPRDFTRSVIVHPSSHSIRTDIQPRTQFLPPHVLLLVAALHVPPTSSAYFGPRRASFFVRCARASTPSLSGAMWCITKGQPRVLQRRAGAREREAQEAHGSRRRRAAADKTEEVEVRWQGADHAGASRSTY
jgi:hypothetical protein